MTPLREVSSKWMLPSSSSTLVLRQMSEISELLAQPQSAADHSYGERVDTDSERWRAVMEGVGDEFAKVYP
jgi:hypothetical protein